MKVSDANFWIWRVVLPCSRPFRGSHGSVEGATS
jgi:hypothetical protein